MELETVTHGIEDGLYYPRAIIQRSGHKANTKAVMCRTHNWKYVYRLYEDDELYDLVNDPHETQNLIHGDAYKEVLTEMKELLLKHTIETADVVPLTPDDRLFHV